MRPFNILISRNGHVPEVCKSCIEHSDGLLKLVLMHDNGDTTRLLMQPDTALLDVVDQVREIRKARPAYHALRHKRTGMYLRTVRVTDRGEAEVTEESEFADSAMHFSTRGRAQVFIAGLEINAFYNVVEVYRPDE